MPTAPTPSQVLAETLLGRSLDEYVGEKRNARPRWPWALIAEELSNDTEGKVNVTRETLRLWYGDTERQAS